jgi:hypothetical protein
MLCDPLQQALRKKPPWPWGVLLPEADLAMPLEAVDAHFELIPVELDEQVGVFPYQRAFP